jgi:hypothetical protein
METNKPQRIKPDAEKIAALTLELYKSYVTNPSAITSIYYIRHDIREFVYNEPRIELGRHEDIRKVVIEELQKIMSKEGKLKK